jgi:hypothetical protein
MNRKNSTILLGIELKENRTSVELASLLSKLEYSDEEGIGFKNVSTEDDYLIVGEALKKTPIYINLLNPITQEIEKKEEFVLSEIEFAIDLKHSILEAYSNHRDLKKLLLVFRSLAKDAVSISQLSFSIPQLMLALKDRVDRVEIKKMCIKDFQYEVGVTGTYDMIFYNSEIAWSLLEKYPNGISTVTFHISHMDLEMILSIGANGQVKFNNKSKNSISECLELLKSLITKPN